MQNALQYSLNLPFSMLIDLGHHRVEIVSLKRPCLCPCCSIIVPSIVSSIVPSTMPDKVSGMGKRRKHSDEIMSGTPDLPMARSAEEMEGKVVFL